MGPLGTNFSEILIGIQISSINKMHLKMSSAKWRLFCLGLNELTDSYMRYQAFREVRDETSNMCGVVRDNPEYFVSPGRMIPYHMIPRTRP